MVQPSDPRPSAPSDAAEPPEPSAAVSDRRRFLAAAAAAGTATVAGCSSVWSQPGATDVVAHNAADEQTVVTVRVTPAGADAAHTERTLELAPNGTVDPVNDSTLPTNDAYTVEVAVEDGPSETFEWSDPSLELAPLYVLVDGSDNVHFLLKAG